MRAGLTGALIAVAIGLAATATAAQQPDQGIGATARKTITDKALGGAEGAALEREMGGVAQALRDIDGLAVVVVSQGVVAVAANERVFGGDGPYIPPGGSMMMREVARTLQQFPHTEALIVVHGGSRAAEGSAAERAVSIRNFLVRQGVAEARLETAARGGEEPAAGAPARRVEIVVFASSERRRSAR